MVLYLYLQLEIKMFWLVGYKKSRRRRPLISVHLI